MRASVLHGVEDVRLEEREVPRPGPREVLVRVASVGVCGSDVHYYRHGRIGDFVVREPMVLGHEASGEVVAAGSDAASDLVGRRVSIEPGVPCLSCGLCLSGHYNLCPEVRFFATPPVDGAFCEYVTIDERFAHPVPDSVDDDAAALLEPLSVGVWACRRGGLRPGRRVLVTGAGAIGLLSAATAAAHGAAEVVVADIDPARLALAAELGATATLDLRERTLAEHGVEPDLLLECSGQVAVAAQALDRVRPAGHAVLVGMSDVPLELGLTRVQSRELQITGTFRYANTWPEAIELVSSGRVDPTRLVGARVGLDGVDAALGTPPPPGAVKTMVRPGL